MNETEMMVRQPQKLSFSQYVNSKGGQTLISNAIKEPARRNAFTTAIISAVATNPGLQECTAPSIISAALQGVSMGLIPSPQIGQFYMVPFKDKKNSVTKATFVIGYKGYIQLAQNTGKYLDIDAKDIREGEFIGLNSFTGQAEFEFIADYNEREKRPVIGYLAYFILQNGFKKSIYWPKEKVIDHADKYSQAFSKDAKGGKYPKVSFADYEAGNYPQRDAWLYSSFWYKNFDAMAEKTLLRQLISKWGPMSVEMQNAIELDRQSEEQGVDYGVDSFAEAAIPDVPAAPAQEPSQEPAPDEPQAEEPAQAGLAQFDDAPQVSLDDL